MQKWAYFTMGAMAGVIALLAFALILQSHDNVADAAQAVDNDSKGLIVVSGGSQPQVNDILWVLHQHDPLPGLKVDPDDETNKYRKPGRLSLLMYRCENGMKLKFVSARDLSYDEELTDFNTDKPSAAEVYRDVKKAVERGSKQK